MTISVLDLKPDMKGKVKIAANVKRIGRDGYFGGFMLTFVRPYHRILAMTRADQLLAPLLKPGDWVEVEGCVQKYESMPNTIVLEHCVLTNVTLNEEMS